MDVHTKVYLHNYKGAVKEIHRVSHAHANICQFSVAYDKVCGLCGVDFVRLEYEDLERDRVVVSTQEEWDECLRSGPYGRTAPLRLHVSKKKTGPKATPSKGLLAGTKSASGQGESGPVAAEVQAQPPPPPALVGQAKVLVDILARYGSGSLSAMALPSWLGPAFKASPGDTIRVDSELDVDLDILQACLSNHAYEQMNTGDNAQALQLFQDAHTVKPTKLHVYNIGCCLALLGRSDEALEALEVAVALGYKNFPHMLADEDLLSVRSHPRFAALAAAAGTFPESPASVAADPPASIAEPAGAAPAAGVEVGVQAAQDEPEGPDVGPVAEAPSVPAEEEGAATDEVSSGALQLVLELSDSRSNSTDLDPTEWDTIPAENACDELTAAQQEFVHKLHELGFTSDADNVRVLRATNWNLREAVELLL